MNESRRRQMRAGTDEQEQARTNRSKHSQMRADRTNKAGCCHRDQQQQLTTTTTSSSFLSSTTTSSYRPRHHHRHHLVRAWAATNKPRRERARAGTTVSGFQHKQAQVQARAGAAAVAAGAGAGAAGAAAAVVQGQFPHPPLVSPTPLQYLAKHTPRQLTCALPL